MQLLSGKKTKEKAVEETILANYDKYYRLAYSYVHNEADAADIVQNTAYRAIRAGKTLKEIDFAATWVYRILLNEIFRACKAKPEQISLDTMRAEQGSQAEPSAEDSYTDVDLANAMETLSPEDKMVIQLRYYEDLKLEQVAEILQENVSTVKSRLYRSMKKLRIAYAGEES